MPSTHETHAGSAHGRARRVAVLGASARCRRCCGVWSISASVSRSTEPAGRAAAAGLRYVSDKGKSGQAEPKPACLDWRARAARGTGTAGRLRRSALRGRLHCGPRPGGAPSMLLRSLRTAPASQLSMLAARAAPGPAVLTASNGPPRPHPEPLSCKCGGARPLRSPLRQPAHRAREAEPALPPMRWPAVSRGSRRHPRHTAHAL
jgi:hypothetical protein